jgi:hypothetical protein
LEICHNLKITKNMELINSIEDKKQKLLNKINNMFNNWREIDFNNELELEKAVYKLRQLRISDYENINQYQHEALILSGIEWLENQDKYKKLGKINWSWHPNQTGGSDEPDLKGEINGKTIISAEFTTSENPKGLIDTRMRNTLAKLKEINEGDLYYFVRTKEMEQRAITKVGKLGGAISITKI